MVWPDQTEGSHSQVIFVSVYRLSCPAFLVSHTNFTCTRLSGIKYDNGSILGQINSYYNDTISYNFATPRQHQDRKAGHQKKMLWAEIVKPTSVEIYVEMQIILVGLQKGKLTEMNWPT